MSPEGRSSACSGRMAPARRRCCAFCRRSRSRRRAPPARRAAGAGRTIVLATQILREAEELCDDILILNRGRQAARGDLHTLKLLSPGVYDVTVTFDRLPPGIEDELAARRPIRLSITQNTVEVTLKEDDGGILAVVGALARRGRVLRLEVGGAS